MNIKFPGTSLDDSRCPSAVQEYSLVLLRSFSEALETCTWW